MSVTPARPLLAEPRLEHKASAAATAHGPEPATDTPQITGPHRTGWMPHHAPQHQHAAHWVALTHRAAPPVAIGVRAGTLVPPRGAVVARRNALVEPLAGAKSGGARGLRGGPLSDSDAGVAADAEAARSRAGSDGGVVVVGSGPSGGGADANADGGGGTPTFAADAPGDRGDAAHPLADSAGVESAAHIAARLQSGELCWVASLRLAMQCAQCHPGTDIFVQAFNIVDADGCVLPAFSRRARLRAVDDKVQVREEPATAAHAGASSLVDELSSSPLLALSLRPVVDEAGQPASALHGLVPGELSALRALFERPLPGALREALCNAITTQRERWRSARENAGFDQLMALRGDALQRQLDGERARLSLSIAAGDLNAHRALANWQRAQAQVVQWARDGIAPTWRAACRLNELLGEGLKPWNRADQADRVGARFGELRRLDVVAGSPPQYFLRADQLREAVDGLFEWLDEQGRFETPVPLVAAQLAQRLLSLHPFADANGRTARLLVDWLMLLSDLPPPLLQAHDMALFANESAASQPAPGLAERMLVEGLCGSVDMHLDWLGLDDPG
jgi:hypothetical protein